MSVKCVCLANYSVTVVGALPVPGTDSRYRECFQTALNEFFIIIILIFISFFSLILVLEGKCLVSGMGRREESISQLIINMLW